MAAVTMTGRRRDLTEWSWTEADAPQPGDYGKQPDGQWYCVTPSGRFGGLTQHAVIENLDGTITVSPSILVSEPRVDDLPWHGWLIKGEWTQA